MACCHTGLGNVKKRRLIAPAQDETDYEKEDDDEDDDDEDEYYDNEVIDYQKSG